MRGRFRLFDLIRSRADRTSLARYQSHDCAFVATTQPLPEAVRPAPAPRPRSACAAERAVAPPAGARHLPPGGRGRAAKGMIPPPAAARRKATSCCRRTQPVATALPVPPAPPPPVRRCRPPPAPSPPPPPNLPEPPAWPPSERGAHRVRPDSALAPEQCLRRATLRLAHGLEQGACHLSAACRTGSTTGSWPNFSAHGIQRSSLIL
jgi:hypothetical protein